MSEFNLQKTKELILQLKVCIINNNILMGMLKDEPEGFIVNTLDTFSRRLSLHLQSVQASIPEDQKHEFKYSNLLD
jgi:hypothetical protein